jgi:hypothetical protein
MRKKRKRVRVCHAVPHFPTDMIYKRLQASKGKNKVREKLYRLAWRLLSYEKAYRHQDIPQKAFLAKLNSHETKEAQE